MRLCATYGQSIAGSASGVNQLKLLMVTDTQSLPEELLVQEPEIELSVLMPCLNEAETLATCIHKAQRSFAVLGVAGEVVVADNGSTDNSVAIALAHGARVVHQPEKGYGAALQAGIDAAP